jgi:Flp pilus assembly protein TadD
MDRPQDALNALHQAAEFAPFNGVEQAKECELLLFTEQNQESVACYRTFEKKTALDSVSKINLGIGLMRLEQWKEAEEQLEPVEAEMQYNARYYNALGMIRYRTRQYKAAVDAFKRATELAPDEMDVRFNLALAQLAIRDKPGALSQYKLLSDSDPKLAQELYRAIYSDKILFVNNK